MISEAATEAAAHVNRKWRQLIYTAEDGYEVGVLELTHPDGRFGRYIFDAEFIEEVKSHNWHITKERSARTNVGGDALHLHWLVMGETVKHNRINQSYFKNGDSTDCRRENLVNGTRREVSRRNNPSVLGVGVFADHPKGRTLKYRVKIMFGGGAVCSPAFQILEQAQQCSAAFVKIAKEFDAGTRERPTREELRKIADKIRSQEATSATLRRKK